MIQTKHLQHAGGFYPYSVHLPKLRHVNNGFSSLKSYLEGLFHSCPDAYFQNGGPRSSTLKTAVPFDIITVQGHEVSALAEAGLAANAERYANNHLKVQSFMLEQDAKTFAIEVPLWMQHHELDNYAEIFRTIQPLTGHIDLLRIENDTIWIWDYKPKARKEKYAATQVYFYALMLSARTGIPLEHLRCGWFDDNDAFLFKPKSLPLAYNKELSML